MAVKNSPDPRATTSARPAANDDLRPCPTAERMRNLVHMSYALDFDSGTFFRASPRARVTDPA